MFQKETCFIMDAQKDWKIYTRQGDKGKTSLLGGTKVSKYHEKIEAYGTLDELNSFIGYLRDQDSLCEDTQKFLYDIQQEVFAAESLVAAESEDLLDSLPKVSPDITEKLEKAIDEMNKDLPELKNFILPGGHPAVSVAHVARTVCRRAERKILIASDIYPVENTIIIFLNRLSDYFFVLARYLAHQLDIPENKWAPRAKHP